MDAYQRNLFDMYVNYLDGRLGWNVKRISKNHRITMITRHIPRITVLGVLYAVCSSGIQEIAFRDKGFSLLLDMDYLEEHHERFCVDEYYTDFWNRNDSSKKKEYRAVPPEYHTDRYLFENGLEGRQDMSTFPFFGDAAIGLTGG